MSQYYAVDSARNQGWINVLLKDKLLEFYLLVFLIWRTSKYQETHIKEVFQSNKKGQNLMQESANRVQLSHTESYPNKILREVYIGFTE